uniref:scabin-related ADP-ribosyltransferase n=1 Tax=Aquidulcibacter sp. TaxID=2052990 RepID=UPI0037C0612F
YKLAQANGLSGDAALSAGQTLRIPAGVVRNTYNAATITPTDPADTLGDVNPTSPQAAPPKKQKCGVVGTILLVVIAIAVTIATSGALAGLSAKLGTTAASSMLNGIAAVAKVGLTSVVSGTTAVAIGAVSAAVGSIVSQAVGVATGIQDKFSWKSVGLAFISGGLGAGLDGAFDKIGNATIRAAAQGAATSAISQGIGVALGLQDKFSWAAVAAAGVGSAVGSAVGGTGFARGLMASGRLEQAAGRLLSGTAAVIASAATRSAIDGSDFNDGVRAAMPDMLGAVLGNFMMSKGPLWGYQKPPVQIASLDGAFPSDSSTSVDTIIVTAKRHADGIFGRINNFIASVSARATSGAQGAWDDVTSSAFVRGIERWSQQALALPPLLPNFGSLSSTPQSLFGSNYGVALANRAGPFNAMIARGQALTAPRSVFDSPLTPAQQVYRNFAGNSLQVGGHGLAVISLAPVTAAVDATAGRGYYALTGRPATTVGDASNAIVTVASLGSGAARSVARSIPLSTLPQAAGTMTISGGRVAIGESGGVARLTFRGDSRSPDVIFNEGFAPRGSSTDLLAHAHDNTLPPSSYVSTSKSAEVAAGFADNVYVVRSNNGIDVNRALGPTSPFPWELEIAIPGGVQPSNVRAVTLPRKGVSILNPDYKQ